MTKKYTETGKTIAAMGTIANMIRQAAREKGIDVGLPQESSYNGHIDHFWLDVPVAGQTYRIMIMRPEFAGRTA